ncbi:protein DENND6B isoform X2 [Parasteatoda tepidariorum]|uniref:protein DENND6B isoform X2 n=1 Tax=Parasteatoda tepidariorum TaxID=114398 RepID=UPI001C71E22F|nr:protein DENND6B isoform X2 [Parasteatoda tepidariorum]
MIPFLKFIIMDFSSDHSSNYSTAIDAAFQCITSSHSNSHNLSELPWDRFSRWVYCICVVTFDLELGQAMEMVYPAHVKLTEKEKASICYMAFPDSNSGCMGNTQFYFRMRQCPVRRPNLQVHEDFNKSCMVPLQIDFCHYLGFVYFRQVKDKSLPRGYFQKSMVLLTKLPLVSLFTEVLGKIAPSFFSNGEPCLESACHDIDQWPHPAPGLPLSLPLMGNVLQVYIPSRIDASSPISRDEESEENTVQIYEKINIPSSYEVDIFQSFLPVLSHIQLLWELVVTSEPIIVMASSPTITCDIVQALISMIWPLKYCCDYRPFFTIHDSEFKEYTTKVQAPPPVILGVTNPFFAKTLQHWPHIIRIGDLQSVPNKHKIKRGGNIKVLDSKPGLYTQYKPFLSKDKDVLKHILKGIQSERPVEVQNTILRHYLLELTQSFIIPLDTPMPRPFNPDDFLKSIEQSGPQLTSGIKGNWSALYRRFFRSANFAGWYNSRYKEVTYKLQGLHIQAISEADMLEWIKDKEEVEIVDLVLRLRNKLAVVESGNLSLPKRTAEKLQSQVSAIIATLPDDLQNVLK